MNARLLVVGISFPLLLANSVIAETTLSKVCSVVDCIKIAFNSIEDAYKRYEPDFKEFHHSFPTAVEIGAFSEEIGTAVDQRNETGALFSMSMYTVHYEEVDGTMDTAVVFKGIRLHGFGRNAPDAIYKGEVFGEDGYLSYPNATKTPNIKDITSETSIETSAYWVHKVDGDWRVLQFSPNEMNSFIRKAYDRRRVNKVTQVLLGKRDTLAAMIESANQHVQVSKAALDRVKDASIAARLKALDASRELAEANVKSAVADYKRAIRDHERYKDFERFASIVGAATSVISAYNNLASDLEPSIENNYSSILRGVQGINSITDQKETLILGEINSVSVEMPKHLDVDAVNLSDSCCTLNKHDVTIFTFGQK